MTAAGASEASDLKRLRSFLTALHALQANDTRPTTDRLENFLREFARLRKAAPRAATAEKSERPLDTTRLREFATKFRPLLQIARRDGAFVDVWNVAGVQSNEIRNAAILAWLLDARQTHGCGNAILGAWLRRLNPEGLFPFLSLSSWGGPYSVVTESYFLGDIKNRVDVVAESPHALMFIEVKVSAPEGERQIERYLALADAKAKTRAHAMDAGVIYLTPSSAASPAIHAATKVVHARWTDVAYAIEEVVASTNGRGFVDRLLVQFADHVRRF